MTYLPDLESRGNYLIVAANRNMDTALDTYVEYKLKQGYNVDVVYLNQHNALGNVDAIVDLDEERKAVMVSNLLVVLCGNHDAQPVVNSGTLY